MRRPFLLSAGAIMALLAGAAGRPSATAAGPSTDVAGDPTGANLDWAVDTSEGGWCTAAPRPLPSTAALPITIEGWYRPRRPGPAAVLVDLWDASRRQSWVRLALDREGGLRLESGTAPASTTITPAATPAAGRGPWTHVALRLRPDAASLQ